MSYIPTEWQTGDIVTAEKLNKLEEGVASGGGGGGGLLVTMTFGEGGDTATLNKNYNEIRAAVLAGIVPSVIEIDEYESTEYLTLGIIDFVSHSFDYRVGVVDMTSNTERAFVSDTATGILTWTDEG